MRDVPLILHVPWGKNRGDRYFLDYHVAKDGLMCKNFSGGQDAPRPPGEKRQKTIGPQKKEEPRGNGALNSGKT